MSPYNTSLAFSLALLAVMFALAYLLHRRRWILRV
jgi:predicted acyltransferase